MNQKVKKIDFIQKIYAGITKKKKDEDSLTNTLLNVQLSDEDPKN